MSKKVTSGLRVTVDPATLAWAVNSASIFMAELDPAVRARIENHDLPWGVPVRITVGSDRVLIDAEIGEDLRLANGGAEVGDRPQPLTLRYAVPAQVSGELPEDGRYPTWILPADYLAESLQTGSEKRADEHGTLWYNLAKREVTLRMTSVPEMMQEYIEEKRQEDPAFEVTEEEFRKLHRVKDDVRGALTMRTDRVLVTSTEGRRDFYCPVVHTGERRLRRAELDIRPIEGPAVDFDFKRMLVAGYASMSGSDGVLIDPKHGRIVAPTQHGLYVFGQNSREGDGKTTGRPSDADLAGALGLLGSELRAQIREAGESIVAGVFAEDHINAALLIEAVKGNLDNDAIARCADEILATLRAKLGNFEVEDGDFLRSAAVQTSVAAANEDVDRDALREIWVKATGRASVEMQAARTAGLTMPVRTLSASGKAAVVSPRMMFAAAFSALQAEERLPVVALEEAKRRSRVIHVAAAAAACDLGPEMREQLASSTMLVAVAKARKAKAERTKEVAALLKDIDAPGLQQVAERISAHAETRGASEAVASLTDTFAPAHGGDRIRAMVAATFEASAGSDEKEFDQVIAGAVGRARIESEVRARFNTSGKDMSPGEIPVTGYDFASAHMRLVGRRSSFELDVRRTLDGFEQVYGMPAHPVDRAAVAMACSDQDLAERAPWAAWGEAFIEKLKQSDRAGENLPIIDAVRSSWAMDVEKMLRRSPEEVSQVLALPVDFDARNPDQVDAMGRALTAVVKPQGKTLDFSNQKSLFLGASFSEDRKKVDSMSRDERRAFTAGRIGVDESGRTHFSVASPDGRWGAQIIDRAAVVEPELFLARNKVDEEMIAEVLDGKADLARFTIPREDLIRLAARVSDVADPRRRNMRALLTFRWEGEGADGKDPEVGAMPSDHTRTAEGYPLSSGQAADPASVGGHLRFYVFGDEGREVYDVPMLDAYAVDVAEGEGQSPKVREELGRKRLRSAVVSAVIDATQFHDIAGFAAEATKAVPVAVATDGALIFRGGANRVAVRAAPARMKNIPVEERPLIERLTSDSALSWKGAEVQSVEDIQKVTIEAEWTNVPDEADVPDLFKRPAYEDAQPEAGTDTEIPTIELDLEAEPSEAALDDDVYSDKELESQQGMADDVRARESGLVEAELQQMRALGIKPEAIEKRERRFKRLLRGTRFKESADVEKEIFLGQGTLFDDLTEPKKPKQSR